MPRPSTATPAYCAELRKKSTPSERAGEQSPIRIRRRFTEGVKLPAAMEKERKKEGTSFRHAAAVAGKITLSPPRACGKARLGFPRSPSRSNTSQSFFVLSSPSFRLCKQSRLGGNARLTPFACVATFWWTMMAMVMSRSITRFFAHPGPNSPERMADAASGRDALSRWDHAHRRNERAPFRGVGLNKMRQSLDSLTARLY